MQSSGARCGVVQGQLDRRSASCGSISCAEALAKLLLCACKQRLQKPLLSCNRRAVNIQKIGVWRRGRLLPQPRVSVPNCFRVRVCSSLPVFIAFRELPHADLGPSSLLGSNNLYQNHIREPSWVYIPIIRENSITDSLKKPCLNTNEKMTRDDGSSGERRVVKEKMTQKLLKKERSSQLQGRKRKQNLHFTPTNHHFRLLTTTSRAECIGYMQSWRWTHVTPNTEW